MKNLINRIVVNLSRAIIDFKVGKQEIKGVQKRIADADKILRAEGMSEYIKMVGDTGHTSSFNLVSGVDSIEVMVSNRFNGDAKHINSLYGSDVSVEMDGGLDYNYDLIKENEDIIELVLGRSIMIERPKYHQVVIKLENVAEYCRVNNLDLTKFIKDLEPVLSLKP